MPSEHPREKPFSESPAAIDAETVTTDTPIRFREISTALEFIAWVMVALAPLLRLANGPPVTDDQAALQATVAGFSLAGAVGLRLYNWRVPLEG